MKLRYALFPLLLAGTVLAGPAQAALVSSYAMTDDVWATPIAAGHLLLDARTAFTVANPNALTLPSLSLVYGLTSDIEVGVWGANNITGMGSSNSSSALSVVNPYVKWQLPWKAGALGFGLTGGIQVPTGNIERNMAVEATTFFPITEALSADFSLGLGRNLLNPANLGHVNLALYYALPGGHSVMAEGCTYITENALPTYGQHFGYALPMMKNTTMDLSVAINESGSQVTGVIPQLGFTSLF